MTRFAVGCAVLAVFCCVAPAHGATAPACLFGCHYRHPIARWKLDHHVARCHTAHCEEKKTRTQDRSVPRVHVQQVYPCIVRWTYNALRWWHLRYGARGPYGRDHVGYGPGYRRCL